MDDDGQNDPSVPITSPLAIRAMQLLDAIELELKDGKQDQWQAVLERAGRLCAFESEKVSPLAEAKAPDNSENDPASTLALKAEKAYQQLEFDLSQVRKAVAAAITTQKVTTMELQKNQDNAAVWSKRGKMAAEQNNSDLEAQARQRAHQFEERAGQLEKQLVLQTRFTNEMRDRLTELEILVHNAYTKRTIVRVRDKVADATTRANEILNNFDSNSALSTLEKYEKKVQEKEARAAAISEVSACKPVEVSLESVRQTIESIQQTLKVFEQLAQNMASKLTSDSE